MLSKLKTLPGVKVLTKGEQKNLKGGRACCNPAQDCCFFGPGCNCMGGGFCNCTGGCTYCYTDSHYCTCL